MTTGRTLRAVALAASAAVAGPAAAEEASVSATEQSLFSLRHQVDVGAFVGLFMPSDEHEFYDPSGSMQSELSPVALNLGLRAAYSPISIVGIEIEGNLIPTWTEASAQRATLLGLRTQVILQYRLPMNITPFVAGGGGIVGVLSKDTILGSDADLLAHLGVGAKYQLTPQWSARADFRLLGGPRVASEDGTTAHGEVMVGAAYHFGARSAPPPPPPPPPPAPVPVDSDGDGILDAEDQCRSEPENVNQWQDSDGCPDTIPDADGDGLDDLADKCPRDPEDVDQFEDENGCPDVDNDGDGVLDSADGCREQSGPVENRGCPDSDRDGDSVVDRLDNCPDEAGIPANRGCKKKQLVALSQTKLEILDKVYFRTNRARIRRRSFVLLNQVASVLKAHPEIPKVIIEGHTDDVGSEERNDELSQQRAEAVMRYLVEQGIEAERLEAKGFGASRPLSPNDSKENRASNRRVEFKIVQPAAKTVPANESDVAPAGGE